MIAVAIFPVFYFFFLKLNLFPVLHCALFSLSADWALLDCVIDRKVRDIIFEAILSPSEHYQNIYYPKCNIYYPEYNSVLPFRIILKIFAVNMLELQVDVPITHILLFSQYCSTLHIVYVVYCSLPFVLNVNDKNVSVKHTRLGLQQNAFRFLETFQS